MCPADFHFMACESQSPLGVYNPLYPNTPSHCPYHIILLVSLDVWLLSLVYNDPSVWGFSRSQTVARYGHPNLLLDPTHLFPPYKNTTSLSDMLLSHGFLWRCLNATVPTMTLSLGTEALQCRGPVGYFSMNEAGCGGT